MTNDQQIDAIIAEIKAMMPPGEAARHPVEPPDCPAPEPALKADRPGSRTQKKKSGSLSSFLFYAVILAAVLTAFFLSTGNDSPRNFFGYSYYRVLTSSMQSVIPKGSLVITKHVDSADIRVGDDITYIKSDKTTVTHRVIAVTENYKDSGLRGFQTKGVNNNVPDPEIVYANNVAGKVIFSSPAIGAALNAVKTNVWFIGAFMAALLIFFMCVQRLRRIQKEEKAAARDPCIEQDVQKSVLLNKKICKKERKNQSC